MRSHIVDARNAVTTLSFLIYLKLDFGANFVRKEAAMRTIQIFLYNTASSTSLIEIYTLSLTTKESGGLLTY